MVQTLEAQDFQRSDRTVKNGKCTEETILTKYYRKFLVTIRRDVTCHLPTPHVYWYMSIVLSHHLRIICLVKIIYYVVNIHIKKFTNQFHYL